MFSANENLVLRQYKKRIVEQIEATIPEDVLDLGTTVMVMQVSCKAPGCVPIETAIIIVFPKLGSSKELLPGLPESCGGNYKTKILKPMSDVTNEDILDALPPSFIGGRRTMSKLCLNARDIMIAQITQLFGPTITENNNSNGGSNNGFGGASNNSSNDTDTQELRNDRRLMAQYLQQQLQVYINHNCQPPEWGIPYPEEEIITNPDDKQGEEEQQDNDQSEEEPQPPPPSKTVITTPKTGNFVVRRNMEADSNAIVTPTASSTTTTSSSSSSSTISRPIPQVSSSSSKQQTKTVFSIRSQPKIATTNAVNAAIISSSGTTSTANNISNLFNREHAPGIRRPGCPCCDPDNVNNIIDSSMMNMM